MPLLLKGSRSFAFGSTRMLTPTLELGIRRDGDDAKTGTGVDVVGSLRYVDTAPAPIGMNGRCLAANADDAYRDWARARLLFLG